MHNMVVNPYIVVGTAMSLELIHAVENANIGVSKDASDAAQTKDEELLQETFKLNGMITKVGSEPWPRREEQYRQTPLVATAGPNYRVVGLSFTTHTRKPPFQHIEGEPWKLLA